MAGSSSVKLHLKSEWQFYLIIVTGGPRRSYQIEELVKVGRVDTFIRNVVHFEQEAPVSQFKLVNQKRPSFALFRDGIKPAWEDPKNKDGGTFSFDIPQTDENHPYIDETWRNIQLSAVASNGLDSLPSPEDPPEPLVNGVIVTLKPDKSATKFFFEVWVAKFPIEGPRKDHFVEQIKKCIKLPEGMTIPGVKSQKHRMGK
jgi:hypothetical protein